MEDIAADISAVNAKISALRTKIAWIKSKGDEKGLSDLEQVLPTALYHEAALTNLEVEPLKRLPPPGIHFVSMPYFINNQ